MAKYIHIFSEHEEKKWNRGHHNVPEIGGGGHVGKVP